MLTILLDRADGGNSEHPVHTSPQFPGPIPEGKQGEDSKVYTGSCHCGAVQLAVKTDPLPSVEVKEDNCSIRPALSASKLAVIPPTAQHAFIGIYPNKSQVTILGREKTKDYTFGRKFNGHPFCKGCGVHLYMNLYGPPKEVVNNLPGEKKEVVRKMLEIQPINVRALEKLVWTDIKVLRSDEGAEGYVLDD